MPCNGGHYFDYSRPSMDVEARKRIDYLTRMLCQACSLVEEGKLPAELDEWWYEHRLQDEARTREAKRRAEREAAEDRRRRYLESVKKRVLGQLTDDEKEALDL